MAHYREVFVGIDVAKLENAIAIAEVGRDREVRYFREVEAFAAPHLPGLVLMASFEGCDY